VSRNALIPAGPVDPPVVVLHAGTIPPARHRKTSRHPGPPPAQPKAAWRRCRAPAPPAAARWRTGRAVLRRVQGGTPSRGALRLAPAAGRSACHHRPATRPHISARSVPPPAALPYPSHPRITGTCVIAAGEDQLPGVTRSRPGLLPDAGSGVLLRRAVGFVRLTALRRTRLRPVEDA
jgi:hypothetical protein